MQYVKSRLCNILEQLEIFGQFHNYANDSDVCVIE